MGKAGNVPSVDTTNDLAAVVSALVKSPIHICMKSGSQAPISSDINPKLRSIPILSASRCRTVINEFSIALR